MSYTVPRAQHVTEAGEQLSRLEDQQRMEFLRRLDAAPIEVTNWEAWFIETQLARQHRSHRPVRFSIHQRGTIDGLRKQYEGRLC